MSAPHADDRDHARPEDRPDGHPAATVLDGPAVPSPRTAPPWGPVPPVIPGPRGGPGPQTPPMRWPAVPAAGAAPVPTVFPDETSSPPAWRRAIAGLSPARFAGLDAAVRRAVPRRAAAIAVGVTFVLAVGALVATYTGTGTGEETGTAQAAPAGAPVPAPPDLISGTTAADPAAFGATPAFTSPSGNIACRMDGADGGEARCDVGNRQWTAADADGCADAGLVVGGAAGSRASCDGAPAPGESEVLRYGTHLTHGDVTCVSRRSGVECRDGRTGHGFTAARATHRLY